MKNTSLILSIVALIASAVLAAVVLTKPSDTNEGTQEQTTEVSAQKGAIVYFDLARVINEYDMANDLRSVVETKVQGIQDEVTRRGNKLQKEGTTFQDKVNKGLLTRSVAESQYQKLQQQEQDFNTYAAQKQQDINEELTVMQNQILDAIQTYVDKYNETKQYALIIANQGGPVITGSAELDITDELLAGLNEEYTKNKGNK